MTQVAAWQLRLLPNRLARTVGIIVIAVAALGMITLAFAVGRWTVDGGAPTGSVPAVVQPVAPAPVCYMHGPC
jgi:hypothetical protein